MIEGVYSLPVIHTLSSPLGPRLRELLADGLADADRHAAIELVREGPGIESSLAVATGFVQRAQAEILEIADNPTGQAMADTAQHLLHSVEAAQAA